MHAFHFCPHSGLLIHLRIPGWGASPSEKFLEHHCSAHAVLSAVLQVFLSGVVIDSCLFKKSNVKTSVVVFPMASAHPGIRKSPASLLEAALSVWKDIKAASYWAVVRPAGISFYGTEGDIVEPGVIFIASFRRSRVWYWWRPRHIFSSWLRIIVV